MTKNLQTKINCQEPECQEDFHELMVLTHAQLICNTNIHIDMYYGRINIYVFSINNNQCTICIIFVNLK